MNTTNKDLLEFPTDYQIKVVGNKSDEFETAVLTILREEKVDLSEDAISERPSKGNKYLALSIKFTAESKAQLDTIYQRLSSHPNILMAL